MLHSALFFLDWFKSSILTFIQTSFPTPQSDLLAGILLGVKSTLPKDFNDALIATGTIHVVVVSGYNISLICGWISNLESYFGKRKTYVLIVSCVIFYTLLTGFQPPTIRAAIMGVLVFGAKVLGRLSDSLYTLILTGFVMVLLDQSVLSSISFQLTFLATLGMILFGTRFARFFHRVPKPFGEDLAATMSAQMLVIPLLLFYFGRLSLVAPLVNALVLWTVPLATVLGFVFIALEFFVPFLGTIVSWFLLIPLTFFYQVVLFSSSLPFAQIAFPSQNMLILIGCYLVIAGYYIGFVYEKTSS